MSKHPPVEIEVTFAWESNSGLAWLVDYNKEEHWIPKRYIINMPEGKLDGRTETIKVDAWYAEFKMGITQRRG